MSDYAKKYAGKWKMHWYGPDGAQYAVVMDVAVHETTVIVNGQPVTEWKLLGAYSGDQSATIQATFKNPSFEGQLQIPDGDSPREQNFYIALSPDEQGLTGMWGDYEKKEGGVWYGYKK